MLARIESARRKLSHHSSTKIAAFHRFNFVSSHSAAISAAIPHYRSFEVWPYDEMNCGLKIKRCQVSLVSTFFIKWRACCLNFKFLVFSVYLYKDNFKGKSW